VWRWRGREIDALLAPGTEVYLKLELFQYAGSFKPRGALLNMLALDPEALRRGVTAVSAGNHAMAVGYAARALGTTAKVVMPKAANPARIAGCRAYGAEVVLVEDVHHAFPEVHRIEAEEGRAFIHPFEGRRTALGTATVGYELCRQVPGLEAVVVPIGGGGLAAGVATAVKAMEPEARVFGVEPTGAASMARSFEAGGPVQMERLSTIADSLAAPHTAPYSFALCRRAIDRLVEVEDQAMVSAMGLLMREMKLATEPAGAAATAALLGPLAEELSGRRVGLIVCGANIDPETFCRLLAGAPSTG
jgi:threonine dehydratase